MSSTPLPVLTALVAGHRTGRLQSGEAGSAVFDQLECLLSLLRQHWQTRAGGSPVRVLTGIADGTDTAAADAAKKLQLPLHILAPCVRTSLLQSQQTAERIVWLGATDADEDAYAVRDEIALAFADLLLIVWDGQSPQGLSGGTVRLAFEAARAMTPIIWIDLSANVRLLDRTRLDDETLALLGTPYPDPTWLSACFTEILTEAQIAPAIDALLVEIADPIRHGQGSHTAAHSAQTEHSAHGNRERERVHRMHRQLRDEQHDVSSFLPPGQIDRWAKRLISGSQKKGVAPNSPIPFPLELPGTVHQQLARADAVANAAAGRHRDATWLLYGASALAVFAAVAGAIQLWSGPHSSLWSITELALLSLIGLLVYLSRHRYWHERWVGHRFVAEQLRYLEMCLPVLGIPKLFRTPCWKVSNGKLELLSAELWHLRRTLAAEGLPHDTAGPEYSPTEAETARRVQHYISYVVASQKNYHDGNHLRMHAIHERLHRFSYLMFAVTTAAVLAHFVLHDAPWLLLFTAFGPALAAAIHGLMTKLEISRISAQSATTHQRLYVIEAVMDKVLQQEGWKSWLRLRRVTVTAAEIMADENSRWQELVGHQEAEIPA